MELLILLASRKGQLVTSQDRSSEAVQAAEALTDGATLPISKPRYPVWMGPIALATLLVTIVIVTLSAHSLGDSVLHRTPQPVITSLALIQLENLSGDPTQEYHSPPRRHQAGLSAGRLTGTRLLAAASTSDKIQHPFCFVV